MPIKIDYSDIPSRQGGIATLLEPIVGRAAMRIEQPRNVGENTFVFAARDHDFDNNIKFSDWRLSTKFDSIKLLYYELWKEDPKSAGDYYLTQKYLHLYTSLGTLIESKEFLALHSDPDELETECYDYIHKVGPHIHFKTAGYPVSKFHISLFLGRFAEVNQSVESLDLAFRHVLEMIEEQLQRFSSDSWQLN
ncbi:hypothetical protein [Deinococcus arcticus]|uniref:hypothetical protein n=1 Tax=Deinococcus arcticus TaxID=2136176 RepID=UPI0011B2701D|nr:hypothetical protein [Deinococcus arcticus]